MPKPSEDEHKAIQDKIQEVGLNRCTKPQKKSILTEASRLIIFGDEQSCLKGIIDKIFPPNICTIPISDLENDRFGELLRIDYQKFGKFKREHPTIDLDLLKDLVTQGIVSAWGISEPSWNRFKKGELNKNNDNFKAFCRVIGYDLSETSQDNYSNSDRENFYNLVLGIDCQQVDSGIREIAKQKRRLGLLKISSPCQCTRAWMLQRIQRNVIEYQNSQDVVTLNFDLEHMNLFACLGNIPSILGVKRIEDVNPSKNILLIFDKIDCLDLHRLENVFLDWYKRDILQGINPSPFFFLIIVLDHGKTNNWWSNKNLRRYFTDLPAINLETNHLKEKLDEICAHLQFNFDPIQLSEEILNLSQSRLQSPNENHPTSIVEIILRTIYKTFNFGHYFDGETRWFNYP